MKTKNTWILNIMNVLFWVIFIGLCIKTGGLLWGYIASMFINPLAAGNLNLELNLSELYQYDVVYYSIIVLFYIALNALKAYIGYYVVRIFMEMKLEKPFSEAINKIITSISWLAFFAGLCAVIGQSQSEWLMKKGISIPIDWVYGETFFFAGVIYIISLVFAKGIELQSENELTV